MGARSEGLGGFLRSRRDRVQPVDVGLPSSGSRRVAGLRRDEVAHLAGVSTVYLVRLEQGRDLRPSRSVLDALGAALGLDDQERAYLHLLGSSPHRQGCNRQSPPERASRNGQRLLQAVPTAPALLLSRNLRVLEQNAASVALLGCLRGQNLLACLVLDPGVRTRHLSWESTVSEMIGFLRASLLRDGGNVGLCQLIPELQTDATFNRLWEAHEVTDGVSGTTAFIGPDAAVVTYDYQMLPLADDEQWLRVYTRE